MAASVRARGALIAAYLGPRRRRLRRAARRLGRRLRGGTRRLTFYFRPDSPQSYLLAQALERFVEQYPSEVQLVVVPAPAADVDPEPGLRAAHDHRDAQRIAAPYGLFFPEAGTDSGTLPVEARGLHASAVLLEERPWREQLGIARELGEALFADDGAAIARLTAEHGAIPGQDLRPRLEENYRRLRAAGHYQDASVEFEGEWYVGVDRLRHLEERLRAEGLTDAPPRWQALVEPPPPAQPRRRVPVSVFFSFRSPYSYLALARLRKLEETHPLEVVLKPVLPMVMRGLSVPPLKRRYLVEDAAREAARLELPFGKLCDPLGPAIDRCLAVCHRAATEGKAAAFAESAARGIWSEALDLGTDADLLLVAERAGLDEAAVREALADDAYQAWVAGHREELSDLGLWGVPSFHVGSLVDGLAIWGQDRIPWLLDEVARRAEAP